MWFLSLLHVALAADLQVGPGQTYTTLAGAAAAAADGDRILVEPGVYPEAAMNLDGQTLIFEAANGPGTVTVELASGAELIDVDFSADITWRNLEFDGGGVNRFALVRRSTFTVEGSTLTGVSAATNGGAFSARDSTVTITDSTIEGPASANGGLVYLDGTDLTVSSSTLSGGDNPTGGAIRGINGSSATVSLTTFQSNTATDGSAIHLSGGDLSLTGGTITGNATTDGTVVCSGGGSCSIDGVTFQGNAAFTGAMLIANGPATTTINNVVFCGTRSAGQRHLDLVATDATVTWSIFYDNRSLTGPQVRVAGTANADFINNHFVGAQGNNTAPALEVLGGGLVKQNLFLLNESSGAALSTVFGNATATYNLFWDNQSIPVDAVVSATNIYTRDARITPTLPAANCNVAVLIPPTDSGVIDAGDPGITDPDGSRVDIGAFTNLTGNPLTDGDDDDGDGYDSPEDDCNDEDPTIHPGAEEIFCDGIDQDCDPATGDDGDRDGDGVSACDGDCDDDNPNVQDLVDVYVDQDMDGYGRGQQTTPLCGIPLNGSLINGDCDDTDPNTYPGAVEIFGDEKDNDCDGSLKVDNDGDGASWEEDCDDFNANRFPDNPEIPSDGKDQDCDGWDGALAITGNAGITCGGCSSTGGTAPFWVPALLALVGLRRRE